MSKLKINRSTYWQHPSLNRLIKLHLEAGEWDSSLSLLFQVPLEYIRGIRIGLGFKQDGADTAFAHAAAVSK